MTRNTPEPKSVFSVFEQICSIPHGSGNLAGITEYCLQFAEKHGLRAEKDAAGNVLIRKPASAGYEDHAPVILQAHLDMVAEKTADCDKDLSREGLTLVYDGDWLRAEKTTLGADDGIGVAFALAALSDETVIHPPLEVLLTADEEIGMLGAVALNGSAIRGRRLINLDEEQEGVFIAGCAGGVLAVCRIPIACEPCAADTFALTLAGLKGGHSGQEIARGGANACILMGRVLRELAAKTELRLVDLRCDGKDNAIASACTARFTARDADAVRKCVPELEKQLRSEYTVDSGLRLTLCEDETAERTMTAEATRRCLDFLLLTPNGVMEMSRTLPGHVQTSLNLGILRTDERELTASFCVRSSVAAQKKLLLERLRVLCERFGGSVSTSGDYPAWEYCEDSALRALALRIYREQTGKEPSVNVTHGGLECGLFSEKLPGLDVTAYGPDIRGAHTPREKLRISSVETTWKFTKELLRQL